MRLLPPGLYSTTEIGRRFDINEITLLKYMNARFKPEIIESTYCWQIHQYFQVFIDHRLVLDKKNLEGTSTIKDFLKVNPGLHYSTISAFLREDENEFWKTPGDSSHCYDESAFEYALDNRGYKILDGMIKKVV